MSSQQQQQQEPKSNPKATKQNTRSPSISTHLAMVELKQKILTSLSKLSDRDTHQIAIEDLQTTIQNLSPEALPMLLNSLYDAVSSDPKPSARKDSLRLLAFTCAAHPDSSSAHLTKIIGHVIKRLKDSDSAVRDACRDAIGSLSNLYLKPPAGNNDSVVGLFVRPLFEAMAEQNKVVQSGAAMCMAKMVECAAEPPVSAFQKLCPRICRLLNNPNFLNKASLLPVVASLSQVGAIAPQSLENLLQSIHECLGSTDWATRKAAADALTALALHSSVLISDKAASTLTVLESCRFDKIKPVRDSITEALQLWKKIAGKGGDVSPDDEKPSRDGETPGVAESSEKNGMKNPNPSDRRSEQPSKNSSNGTSPSSDSVSKAKGSSFSEKAVVILKKKAPGLTEKELNLEFFQKLETRGSDDLPVEVVVPRRCLSSSNANNEEESELNDTESRGRSNRTGNIQHDDFHGSSNSKYRNIERGASAPYSKRDLDDLARDKWPEERINGRDSRMRALDGDDRIDINQRESSGNRVGFSKTDGQSEGSFINNKGNWLAIQRQLLQLERQQAHLMNMLQDFMGGSHDSMVTLENRVRGLERVVEDMARDLSISSGRRGGNFAMGFEGSSNRPLGKYNGFPDYSTAKFGRGSDGRIPFGERIAQSDGIAMGMRGRGPPWRSDMSEAWDFPTSGTSRNGQIGSRRALGGSSMDGRSPKSDHESDQGGSRRAWDKGAGPVRLGEGPSARSVWQASKDEATLEAIRVAGEDGGTSRTARVAIPEMTAEAMGDDNVGHDRDPVWTSWSNAMDALHVGDMDSAYAEVLSTGDDHLLVKLMDRSGPVVDQLSGEVATEVVQAVGQFLLEQNLFDLCLSWIQQLVEVLLENGPDVLSVPMEVKKELLLNLHEASTAMDPPEDWEGVMPDQLLLQLASAWGIDLQQHEK
ncbi:microtubule-associated protein TORTIFOLIA1 [Quercus robur]|uniref:microtubule-associated protein TORTIFOLIA1 n=1 Tax=Quercus robur TaxID=38942 RepID=UPI002161C2DC|nr:microtubule-associated protein TORTIFOLIA1 [Quercus robur]